MEERGFLLPFGDGHDGRDPKGIDLSLQGVCVVLGGVSIFSLGHTTLSTLGGMGLWKDFLEERFSL